ncbi:MAG: sugar ABC transporter ATP-binding protein [Fusobacteriaceae bacterium]
MRVEMKDIYKSFGEIRVLKGVKLDIEDGEVHALMGENGAGKSTMIKVLTGVYTKDAGDIIIDGNIVEINSIKDGENCKIAYVHQELNNIKHLSICDNIFLGKELRTSLGLLDKKKMREICVEKLKQLGIEHLSPDTLVGKLSVGYQQMVEIVKALLIEAKLVILDEPTAALTNKEIENLFHIMGELKAQGVSFLYVSHRMDEIFRISDSITVLRDGKYIGTEKTKNITEEKLVEMMTGKNIDNLYEKSDVQPGKVMLEVREISRKNEFNNISFDIREGEVLGFAGLMGAGRSEIMHAIFGSTGIDSGKIFIEGKEVNIKNPIDANKNGIAFVTEDRKEEGLILDFSIKENFVLPSLKKFIKRKVVDEKKISDKADSYIDKLKVRTISREQKVKNLSGGNQQKVVFAKWLETNPKILILDEPTRGVDIGAKKEIYEVINELKERGVAILLVSSELSEVIGISDRVAVIHNKQLAKIYDGKNINHEEVLKTAFLGGNSINGI